MVPYMMMPQYLPAATAQPAMMEGHQVELMRIIVTLAQALERALQKQPDAVAQASLVEQTLNTRQAAGKLPSTHTLPSHSSGIAPQPEAPGTWRIAKGGRGPAPMKHASLVKLSQRWAAFATGDQDERGRSRGKHMCS